MIDKGAVARSIKNLVVKGYVKVIKDAEDKRINRLFMTPKGEALFEVVNDLNRQWVGFLFIDFSEDEKNFFGVMVEKVSRQSKEL